MTIEELTRERAIEEHRKMWNWIADETEKRNKIVTKEDYFNEHPDLKGINDFPPLYNCWCCEYANNARKLSGADFRNVYYDGENEIGCDHCPIVWPNEKIYFPYSCEKTGSLYKKWKQAIRPSECTHYALEIANLPEREGV